MTETIEKAIIKKTADLSKLGDKVSLIQARDMITSFYKKLVNTLDQKSEPYKTELSRLRSLYNPYIDQASDLKKRINMKLYAIENQEKAENITNSLKSIKGIQSAFNGATKALQKLGQVANEIEKPAVRTRKIWQWEIKNPLDVPRNFLNVDESKIGQAIKTGQKIPGVHSDKKRIVY